MNKRKKPGVVLVVIFLLVAFVGFADAVYLAASHYLGSLPVCTVIDGCDEVALSEWSTIGPVPVALLGTIFYVLMMGWAVLWLDLRRSGMFRFMPFVTVPGFLFSGWLVYLMFFVIEALCLFCLISAGTTTLLMIMSFRLRSRY